MRELGRILDARGMPLFDRVVRYSACDAQADPPELVDRTVVQPFYTLGDQLFVEPQPDAVPDVFDLVLEDDVRFERGFGRVLDQAWREMKDAIGLIRDYIAER